MISKNPKLMVCASMIAQTRFDDDLHANLQVRVSHEFVA